MQPTQLSQRAPSPDDAEALLPLFEAYDVATLGQVDISLADVDMLLRDPRADLAAGQLTEDGTGRAVGLMLPTRRAPAADGDQVVDLEIIVHPDLQGVLFQELLEEAERYVGRLVESTGRPAVAEHWSVSDADSQVLERHGFRPTRTHVRYSRELQPLPAEPSAPEDVRVLLVETEEQRREFHATLVRGFADDTEARVDGYAEWAERMASSDVHDPSQWWLLQVRHRGTWVTAGMLQGNRQDDENGGAWIKNYALLPAFRGRGLGRFLLEWALAEFARRGYRRVGLGADLENTTNALRVYDNAGFQRLYTAQRFSRTFPSDGRAAGEPGGTDVIG